MLLVKTRVSFAIGHCCSNPRRGRKQQTRCLGPAAMSADILAPSWRSETSCLRAVETGAGRVLGFAVVELSSRKCPVHAPVVPWERILVVARLDMFAVSRRIAWTFGEMVKWVSALSAM